MGIKAGIIGVGKTDIRAYMHHDHEIPLKGMINGFGLDYCDGYPYSNIDCLDYIDPNRGNQKCIKDFRRGFHDVLNTLFLLISHFRALLSVFFTKCRPDSSYDWTLELRVRPVRGSSIHCPYPPNLSHRFSLRPSSWQASCSPPPSFFNPDLSNTLVSPPQILQRLLPHPIFDLKRHRTHISKSSPTCTPL